MVWLWVILFVELCCVAMGIPSNLVRREERNGRVYTAREQQTTFDTREELSAEVAAHDECFPAPASEAVKELIDCSHIYLTGILPQTYVPQGLPGPLYINHGAQYKNRRERLTNIFPQSSNAVWMDMFRGSNVTYKVTACLGQMGFQSHAPAVTLANYAVYRHMLEHNLPVAIVMEDDPQFSSQQDESVFYQALQDVWANATRLRFNPVSQVALTIAQTFDFIHFGGCQGMHAFTSKHVVGRFYVGERRDRCTTGYMVSQQGARKMLAVLRKSQSDTSTRIPPGPIGWPIDYMIDKIGRDHCCRTPGCKPIVSYYLEPPLFQNFEHGQNITNGPLPYNATLRGGFVSA